jgi:phage-related protein
VDALCEAIPDIIDAMIEFLEGDGMANLLSASIDCFMAIVEAIPTIVEYLITNTPKIITAIVSSLLSKKGDIKDAATQNGQAILEAFNEKWEEIKEKVSTFMSEIVGKIKEKISEFTQVGGNLITGLWNGISDKANWLYSKITGLGQTVVDKVKSLFGVASPSKVFAEIGGYLAEGLGEGWEDNIGGVEKSINKTLTFKGSVENGNNYTPADNKTTFTLNETVELGGTKLKDIVSTYTIEKIGNETKAVRLATGGAY